MGEVTIMIDVPKITADAYARFMMTEGDAQHGEYSRLVPDARERWRWLYRVAREFERDGAQGWASQALTELP